LPGREQTQLSTNNAPFFFHRYLYGGRFGGYRVRRASASRSSSSLGSTGFRNHPSNPASVQPAGSPFKSQGGEADQPHGAPQASPQSAAHLKAILADQVEIDQHSLGQHL
jgi:hypothetical protein